MRAWPLLAVFIVALFAFPGSGDSAQPAPGVVDATATFPPGPEGVILARGRALLDRTPALLPANVGSALSCSSCHVAAGTKPQAFALLGTYATFPQYNARAHRYITVQDRIAECFLYSMNGKVPAYTSEAMVAITTYIAWLSRGAVVGTGFPEVAMPAIALPPSPDAAAGKTLYAARCSACHGANGSGVAGAFPPLWGPKSFNTGAGMHRTDTLASFIHADMPLAAPVSLSVREAADLAAYILRQPRPRFRGSAPQIFQPEPARFF
jgi:thiosulfate dehydrogenase